MSASSSLSGSFGTLDVNTLVTQLMQVERNPQVLLQNRKLQIQNKGTAIKSVASDVKALMAAAEALNAASKWQPLKSTSSSSAVTTTATSGALTGSVTFRVAQLATTDKRYSATALESTSTKVADGGMFLLAAGLKRLGVGTATAGAGLTTGSHAVSVTAAGKAVKTADSKLAATTIAAENSTLDIRIAGATYTLNLATGEYEGPQELLDAVKQAITDQGLDGQIGASLSSDGRLTFTTTAEGSNASIQVLDSSTALGALGLTADTAAKTGAATITVDGHVNEIADADNVAGRTLTLAGKDGVADAMSFELTGPLQAGTSTVRGVDLGDGSLGAVVNAINGSYGDVVAAAVKTADGYRFQIESKITGADGALNIDLSRFTGEDNQGISFTPLSEAADARIEVRTANGGVAYEVTSSTNTFADVLPGVTFTLANKPPGDETVTITATRDVGSLASKVEDLVKAFNTVIYSIKNKSTYNPETRATGPLLGNSAARRVQSELTAAFTEAVGDSALKVASGLGITLTKEGTLAFDKATFTAAYETDPASVQRMFTAALGDSELGIVQRIAKVGEDATSFARGYLTTSGNQYDSNVASIDKQISAFEERMKIRETALRRQYSALNSMLQQLNDQSTALVQALSNLPTYSSSSSSS